MYHGKITQTGSYLPSLKVSNDDLSKLMDTSHEWIYSRTGIASRHIAGKESVADMAVEAAKRALESASYDAKSIDMIVVATVSSDYSMPSVACQVQKDIGADQAFCFDLQAACSGFVYGLDVVNQYILTGRVKKALLIGVEKLSRLLNWEDRSTCVLFGDGAGAVLVEATDTELGIKGIELYSIGEQWDALVAMNGNHENPFYDGVIQQGLTMDGRGVFQFACTKVTEGFNELFEAIGYTADDMDSYVLHQANKRIIERIAKKMNIPVERFFMNMDQVGNTSAASIPLALDAMNQVGELEGKRVALSGFGAGLTYGVGVIQF